MLDTDFERMLEPNEDDCLSGLSKEEQALEDIVDKIKSMGTLKAIKFLDRLLNDAYDGGFTDGNRNANLNE